MVRVRIRFRVLKDLIDSSVTFEANFLAYQSGGYSRPPSADKDGAGWW